jgi:hypothetical protein
MLSELSIEAVKDARYVLPIRDLRHLLADISQPHKRYRLEDPLIVSSSNDDPLAWIILNCAWPVPRQTTDELTFALPVLSETVSPGQEEDALVCLDADTLQPVQEGLYLEDDRVLGDFMEDWELVWPALGKALAEYTSHASARLNAPICGKQASAWRSASEGNVEKAMGEDTC